MCVSVRVCVLPAAVFAGQSETVLVCEMEAASLCRCFRKIPEGFSVSDSQHVLRPLVRGCSHTDNLSFGLAQSNLRVSPKKHLIGAGCAALQPDRKL